MYLKAKNQVLLKRVNSMKKINVFIAALILAAFTNVLLAQQNDNKSKIPVVSVKTMDGKVFNTGAIDNKGKPYIISFWATWCKPCIKELNAIAEYYADWQESTGMKLIAVSIDDVRFSNQVKTLANGNNWDYEVLLDLNSDFKRAMNVNQIPHTFICNGNNEIVWQHTSFAEGGELELINIIKKIIAGEAVKE